MPLVCDRPCRAQPIRSFVADDRPAGGLGPRVYQGDDTDSALPRRTTGSALAEQIAADLLPEAGDSGTVDGGEGL
jgi:hypothetical protein